MTLQKPPITYRKEYQPSGYYIPEIMLDFDLNDTKTRVESRIHVIRRPGVASDVPLMLDGINIKLENLEIGGASHSPEYEITEFLPTKFNAYLKTILQAL